MVSTYRSAAVRLPALAVALPRQPLTLIELTFGVYGTHDATHASTARTSLASSQCPKRVALVPFLSLSVATAATTMVSRCVSDTTVRVSSCLSCFTNSGSPPSTNSGSYCTQRSGRQRQPHQRGHTHDEVVSRLRSVSP
jgi:hypothetical protein